MIMIKEKLTLDFIKQDLTKLTKWQMAVKDESRLWTNVIPLILFAITLGIVVHVTVGIVVALFAVYNLVRYIPECWEISKQKKAVNAAVGRCDVSISRKTLSHIATQTIREPHYFGRRVYSTKEVTFFYFEGGSSWRLPGFDEYYEWSSEFHLSSSGLCNISVQGNEFYFVALQGEPDATYIYPCKFFELGEELCEAEK